MSNSTGNRFVPITPDNQSGAIWIVVLLCLIYSTLVLTVRAHIRWKMYGLDDWLILASTLTQFGEGIAMLEALRRGIGQRTSILSTSQLSTVRPAIFASQILFILALCLAKCSVVCLMVRLFNLESRRRQKETGSRIFIWISVCLFSLFVLWGLLSVVALAVDCSPSALIAPEPTAHCPHQLLRWKLIAALDIATELLIVLNSVIIVWPVQMALRLKAQVVLAFTFRMIVAPLALLHLLYFAEYLNSSTTGLAIVPVLVLQQVELCWSITSATIPTLKAFVKSFNSGFGLNIDFERSTNYGSRSRSYGLSSLKSPPPLSASNNQHQEARTSSTWQTRSDKRAASPALLAECQGQTIQKHLEYAVHYEQM